MVRRTGNILLLSGLLAAGALLCVSGAASAAASSRRPAACGQAFPGAHDQDFGRTTLYNRQSSVENVVCFGFGRKPSADFTTDGMACALISTAVGLKWDSLGLSIDGVCSGAAIAADPKASARYVGLACDWAAAVLQKTPAALVGYAGGLGCAVAPGLGHALGDLIESKHELDVARDIIDHGKCLKYSPSHFGSGWLAVACATDDPGFANLPGTVTVQITGPADNQFFAAWLNGRRLPETLAEMSAFFPVPVSEKGYGYRGENCRAIWRAWPLTATFTVALSGLYDGCAQDAGLVEVTLGAGWRTAEGLVVGDSLAKLRAVYPRATFTGGAWSLKRYFYGAGFWINELQATVAADGRVGSLSVFGIPDE